MNKLQCRECGKVLGYINDVVYDEDCLCEECYNKAINAKVDFTIVKLPHHISLNCPFCGEDIQIDWDDVPSTYEDWNAIKGKYVECPECKNDIKLGDFDVD